MSFTPKVPFLGTVACGVAVQKSLCSPNVLVSLLGSSPNVCSPHVIGGLPVSSPTVCSPNVPVGLPDSKPNVFFYLSPNVPSKEITMLSFVPFVA
jgi:hypothetical protein